MRLSRFTLAVSAGVSLFLVAGAGWAGSRNKTRGGETVADSGKDKETPASFNKTFQWEEKVVGPKDKGINHDKIASMREQGRREDALKRTQPPKKVARTEGINGPASSTIPTQDIEKPAPAGSIRTPMRKASYVPPKQPDALDNLLAENSGAGADDASGRDGLGKVFGGSSSKSHRVAKHAKHARRRR
jgi:hypothetical protein